MKNKKLLITNALSLFALMFASFGAMSFTSGKIANAVEPKRYGDIYWDIKESTLTISPVPGTNGAMADITSYDEAPWYYYNNKYSCDYIKSIIIEDGVSHIGTEAFCYFNKVTRIDIPQSCKTVSREAFYNCEGLKEVSVYGSVGYYTFAYCYNLEKVTVIRNEPSDYIAEGAFFNCESLKEVTIQISHICEDSFCYCYSLETINLLEGCINIKNEAFYKCQSLKTLYLPSTLKLIEREAFYDCRNLGAVIYTGSKAMFDSITFDRDYNDAIVEALNNTNGRTMIFKATGTYYYFDEENIKSKLEASKEICYFLANTTTSLDNAWYIVDGELDFGGGAINVRSHAKLLLLNNSGIKNLSSLILDRESSLCIYSESLNENEMGYLNVKTNTPNMPAIGNRYGFADLTICGGKITAESRSEAAAIGAGVEGSTMSVTIYGGIITAKGGNNAAGIGSGSSNLNNMNTVSVYIGGGKVTANGGNNAAGIGCGEFGTASVRIYGGTVNANGGENGAAIGSGKSGMCIVNILGGTITGKGGKKAATIGSGYYGDATVYISDGDINIVTENRNNDEPGIGSGHFGNASVTITGGTISSCKIGAGADGLCIVTDKRNGNNGAGTFLSEGSVVIVSILAGIAFVTACVFATLYIRERKKKQTIV